MTLLILNTRVVKGKSTVALIEKLYQSQIVFTFVKSLTSVQPYKALDL